MTWKRGNNGMGEIIATRERSAWDQVIREAEAMGLIRDSGQRRNGEIIWIRTSVRPPWLTGETAMFDRRRGKTRRER
jgi:hypothetical protein